MNQPTDICQACTERRSSQVHRDINPKARRGAYDIPHHQFVEAQEASTTFQVQTYLNDGPGRFRAYEPGDRLYAGPAVNVTVDHGVRPHSIHGTTRKTPDSMQHEALDLTWAIGNREMPDATGQDWPRFVRSLSAGDVLAIRLFDGGPVVAWGIESFGFKALGTIRDVVDVNTPADFALQVSLSEYGKVNERGAFGAPATSLEEAGLADD